MQLVLSLFPGIDLLGRGFEAEGFCIVRGPDIIYGGDIRDFTPPAGKFDGIIGGSPCQDFSGLNRNPGPYGHEMLQEYIRCVLAAQPDWFLLENIARVPDIQVEGYKIQRFDLSAAECGLKQSRRRHFQFGSKYGYVLVPQRIKDNNAQLEPICLASEGRKQTRRTWAEFCQLSGLPPDFDLPGMSRSARYKAVGNGVPIPMGRTVARAIRDIDTNLAGSRLCLCGCGRIVTGNQLSALPACRKRLERRRKRDMASDNLLSTVTGPVTELETVTCRLVTEPTVTELETVTLRAVTAPVVTGRRRDQPGVSRPGLVTVEKSQRDRPDYIATHDVTIPA